MQVPLSQPGTARIPFMEWGASPRLMCVALPDSIHVCRKTLLKHCFRDDMVVIQVREGLHGACIGAPPPCVDVLLTLPVQGRWAPRHPT